MRASPCAYAIGRTVIWRPLSHGSSMDWAKKHIKTVPDGTVFLFDEYKSARGRQGREWKLYEGQLIVTFVVKPEIKNANLDLLTIALTLGVAESLKKYGVKIKWPNDFFIGDKKVGGILIEYVWEGDVFIGAAVGFAINCNNIFSKDDELYDIATSLRSEKNVVDNVIDINTLRKDLFVSLGIFYDKWETCGYEELFDLFLDRLKL